MKITHIYHSGFVIELHDSVLIFDWYSGDLPDFDPEKRVFVFVTHGHADHYSSRIWTLQNKYDHISYILDCCTAPERKGDSILHVQPGRHYQIRNIQVFAIRSNDEGVAYAVSAEGFNFFHAGDLNVWHWNDAPAHDNAYSLKIYRRQLEKINGLCYDVAMIPLDPRLGENAPKAIEEFFRNVHCRMLFPMHYWNRRAERPTGSRSFLADRPKYKRIVILISNRLRTERPQSFLCLKKAVFEPLF